MNETEHPFPSSEEMQVSLLVNQLRVNFTKGERFTLRVFAVTSVGTSDPVSADVIVPCELWMHIGALYIVVASFVAFFPPPVLCSPSQRNSSPQ